MTITSFNTANATETGISRTIRSIKAALVARISEWREIREDRRPFYHNDKEQRLERAQRDVNRLWRGYM